MNKIIKSLRTKLFEEVDQQQMQQIDSYMNGDTKETLRKLIKRIIDTFDMEDDYGTEINDPEKVLLDIARSGETLLCEKAYLFRIKLDKNDNCTIELEFSNPVNGMGLGVAKKWEGEDGLHRFDLDLKELQIEVLDKYNEAVYYFWNELDA